MKSQELSGAPGATEQTERERTRDERDRAFTAVFESAMRWIRQWHREGDMPLADAAGGIARDALAALLVAPGGQQESPTVTLTRCEDGALTIATTHALDVRLVTVGEHDRTTTADPLSADAERLVQWPGGQQESPEGPVEYELRCIATGSDDDESRRRAARALAALRAAPGASPSPLEPGTPIYPGTILDAAELRGCVGCGTSLAGRQAHFDPSGNAHCPNCVPCAPSPLEERTAALEEEVRQIVADVDEGAYSPTHAIGHLKLALEERPQTRQVHNHGPEEGPGLACRESLIGACVRAALEEENRRLREAVVQLAKRQPSPFGGSGFRSFATCFLCGFPWDQQPDSCEVKRALSGSPGAPRHAFQVAKGEPASLLENSPSHPPKSAVSVASSSRAFSTSPETAPVQEIRAVESPETSEFTTSPNGGSPGAPTEHVPAEWLERAMHALHEALHEYDVRDESGVACVLAGVNGYDGGPNIEAWARERGVWGGSPGAPAHNAHIASAPTATTSEGRAHTTHISGGAPTDGAPPAHGEPGT